MNTPIVDSHIHYWGPDRLDYGWLASVPAINRPFLPADLREAAEGFDLRKIVFVQAEAAPDQGVREADFVTELAQSEPRIQAIVAHAPLEQGDGVRDQLATLAANPLVKSIRRLIQSEGVDFPIQPDFVTGVKLVAEYGLRFDLCIFHPQLANTVRLVEQCPEVSFVLDHIGKPDIKHGLMDPWREQIVALADLPNVTCKLSGMVTEADHQHWTPDDLKPYIDHVVAAFGADRIMYGGDWPVSTQAATYRRWIETLDWATADFSPAEKLKLFYQNAVDFYGLPA